MKEVLKKITTGVFILLFVFLFKLSSVSASCYISVSTSGSAVVGQNFKVTVSVPSNAGSWDYTLSYDSSKVRLVSGQLHVIGVTGDSRSSSYTFKSLLSGTASFKATNASIIDYSSTNECYSGSGTASVTMKTQAEIEAGYSRNNNLSSLSIDGANLTPAFSASNTEYTATLPADTTKAIIKAEVADKTATVSGTGEIEVFDGINKIEVSVTAQHGEKKTYTINLTVEELNPIKVKIGNKNYTVVRRSGQIKEVPEGFIETKIKIKDQDITAYENEISKILLVCLKDSEGNIKLFIYDKKNNTYTDFSLASSDKISLLILKANKKDVPLDFKGATFKYNKQKVNGYKYRFDKDNNYYMIYALNLLNGKKDFYLYDKSENTFQRYYDNMSNPLNSLYGKVIFGLGVFTLLVIIIWLLRFLKRTFTSKAKKIKKLNKKLDKLNKKQNDFFDVEDEKEEEPVIKKVEEDDYIMPKKGRKEKRKELMDAKKLLDRDNPSVRRISLEEKDLDDYDEF